MPQKKPTYEELEQKITELEKELWRREKTDADLQDIKQRYERLINTVPCALYDYIRRSDGRTHFIYITPQCKKIFEYDAGSIIENPDLLWNMVHPEDLQRLKQEDLSANKKGEFFQSEVRIIPPSGKTKWIQLTSRPGTRKVDSLVVWSGIIIDITQRKQAEEALAESEKKWRNILVNTPQIGVSLDTQGRIVFANKHFLELTGWKEGKILGQDWFELFIPPEIRAGIRRVFNQAMNGINELDFSSYENEILTKNGGRRYVAWSNVLTRDSHGDIYEVTCLGIDLTERKQAEEELASNYALLRIAGETAKFGGWSVDLNTGKITWSNEVADIHGMPPGYSPCVEEGINFYALEWREKITKVFTDCAEKGIPFDEEMEIITRNAERVWVRTTGEAVTDENGKIIKVQGAFQDITERKQLEAAEEENRKLLEAIYRNAPLVLMVVDKNRRIKQINGFASQFAGRPAEEMLGLRDGEALSCLHAIDHPDGCGFGEECKQCVIRNTVLDTLINGTTNLQLEAPYSLLTETETRELTLLVSATPVTFKGSQMALVTLQDITELKKAQQERGNLQDQLRHAQKMEAIGTLAGGIAHDFNNILSSIIGYTELSLDEVRETTQLYHNLSQVLASGNRAKELVKQILTLSRHEKQEFKPTRVIPLIKEAVKMLRSAIPSSIDFRENYCSEQLIIEADPTQIHQVIVNLVANAKQAMPDGSGILEVSVSPVSFDENILREFPDTAPGDYAQITISDTGAGISEQYLDKIFEPYFTTKQKETGTGLGLSMVYGIVKKHKGFINVESTPGKGSTFKVFLPQVKHDFTTATEQKSETLPGGTENILLVDDEEHIVDIQKQMLERLGYRVFPMTGSLEALKAFRTAPDNFDLLITDMTMPGMTGDTLAQAAKEIRPELPVILCTGFSEKLNTEKHGLQIEAILMKPMNKADLAKTVRKVLDA